jgi:hypothetical protein
MRFFFNRFKVVTCAIALCLLISCASKGDSVARNGEYDCRSVALSSYVPSFNPNITEETLYIEQDVVIETTEVSNLVIAKEGVTVRFAAPLKSGLFAPIQKIGSINVTANGVTLIFAAGDYHIANFVAETKGAFALKTEGSVRIFTAREVKIVADSGARINADAKAQHLQWLIGANANISGDLVINALIYANKDATIAVGNGSLNGAIRANGKVDFKELGARFSYDKKAIEALYHNGDPNEWCLVKPDKPSIFERDKTLLGIDENRNGVRDDVEIAILDKYKSEPILVALSMQGASHYQDILHVFNDKAKAREYSLKETYMECFFLVRDTVYGEPNISTMEGYRRALKEDAQRAWLKDRAFNNEERLKAYWRYNSQLSGMVFHLPDSVKSDCKFDIDAFEVKQ